MSLRSTHHVPLKSHHDTYLPTVLLVGAAAEAKKGEQFFFIEGGRGRRLGLEIPEGAETQRRRGGGSRRVGSSLRRAVCGPVPVAHRQQPEAAKARHAAAAQASEKRRGAVRRLTKKKRRNAFITTPASIVGGASSSRRRQAGGVGSIMLRLCRRLLGVFARSARLASCCYSPAPAGRRRAASPRTVGGIRRDTGTRQARRHAGRRAARCTPGAGSAPRQPQGTRCCCAGGSKNRRRHARHHLRPVGAAGAWASTTQRARWRPRRRSASSPHCSAEHCAEHK